MRSALPRRMLTTLAIAAIGCAAAGCVVEETSPVPTGSGGASSCGDCTPDAPICVDEKACAAACPGGRDVCHTSYAPPGGVCCGEGTQCCEAAVFGYAQADLCYPKEQACPLACPGSTVVCPLDSYCQIDPQSDTYTCRDTCASGVTCGFNVCCPMGSTCVDGACKMADMTIDQARMASSVSVEILEFAADSCEVVEECVGGPGKRTLLRFDLVTPNIGEGDLFLGSPTDNPLFQFSPCHGHYHFSTYADYRLRDKDGNDVAFGHKQAFCLRDDAPNDPNSTQMARYNCSFQGIQAGWSDDYEAELPCQWVDVTGLAPGKYTLHVEINYAKELAESSYDNNVADAEVTVPDNTCKNGCVPSDATCCQPDDPCGWAQNGSCDCADHFGWDSADCGSCLPSDLYCLVASSCPSGCTADTGNCCADGDPCGLGGNNACDCEGHYSWDAADCDHCNSPVSPCPANTCPNGCTSVDMSPSCCQADNPCGWTSDGFCDCGGQFDWDVKDCSHCTTVSPACP
ncbi:MAG: lysyl oxidase family protein [Polyangiaceae bacterium]